MMRHAFYTGSPSASPRPPAPLPASRRAAQGRPEGYHPDPGLVDAANVALLLGQPLLLTGEPGTGKTQFAASLAWELGLGAPLVFETKSTSLAIDLFYTYNALARFHAAQAGERGRGGLEYLTFNALGEAILRANRREDVADLLPEGAEHGGPRRSVVLIDEIDKAPRDLPNDVLSEVEGMYFRIPELGGRTVRADPALAPVVVLTSNSEKNLPDAFLRRCVYYHIPFPDRERLARIVEARLGEAAPGGSAFLRDALDVFARLREPAAGLRKRPATAELLGWVTALRASHPDDENPLDHPAGRIAGTLPALVKTSEDQERAATILARWAEARR